MKWLARWARRMANVIDPEGQPRLSGLLFTFEDGIGHVLHGEPGMHRVQSQGCPLMYFEEHYDRAFAEADKPTTQVLWKNLAGGRKPYTRRYGGRP